MKTLFTTIAMILLLTIKLSAQTTDEIPGPERVLVVYAAPINGDSTSLRIMNHYVDVRSIPLTNIVPINITDPAGYGCEWGPEGEEEIIGTAEKIAGWNYVKEVIADEIEQHLNTTYYDGQLLKNVIRYIVLCKGIPLKVRYSDALGWDGYAYTRNRVSVDALLCLINQPNGLSFTYLFEKDYDDYENPYYDVDPRFTMDYRFISNYFVNQEGWYLQYLVSRLDGDDLGDVIALIDRSIDPDMSGDKYWIIDDDPEPDNPNIPPNLLEETHLRLNYLDFNLNPEVYVSENEWIWNNELYGNEEVIGYVSYGTHAPMPTLYILDTLEFDYANGAIFSSIESFNGFSFGETRAGHGLVSDFITMGGTGGVGTVYEPFLPGGGQDELIFPAYSLGYSLVEAIYQGIKWTAWQNTVVGDPLTRIYECQNTVISTNTTIGSTDYNCDVTVPPGVTLTIASGSTVNFNKNCEFKLLGNLEINEGLS